MQSLAVTLLLGVGALAAPAPSVSNGIKVPLRPRKSHLMPRTNTADFAAFLGSVNHTIQKYTSDSLKPIAGISSPDILRKRQTGYEALTDQVEDGEDELYYGPGTVGGQTGFTFDFDTGSSDTFVPGPTCGTAEGCVAGVQYDNSGTSLGNTTTITYGSGEVTGANYLTTVTIAGLTATNQNVVSLTSAEGFSSSDSDSLMGMAFQSIAASGEPPYFKTLIDEGQVSVQEFSFYLGRDASGTEDNSEMVLGGRDTSKYTGDVTQIAVSEVGYWQIPLDNVVVGGENIVGTLIGSLGETVVAGQAAIDTGTTLVVAPTVAALAIFLQIPGAIPLPIGLLEGSDATFFIYPCDYEPDVSIEFGGVDFEINPLDFNFGEFTSDYATLIGNNTLAEFLDESASYCLAAILGEDLDPLENLYVVGDTFLKNWYSIYSYDAADGSPAVSFAKAI